MLYYNIYGVRVAGQMKQNRLIALLFVLGLVLGQMLSLAHGVEHTLSGQDHAVCAQCLSSPHKYGVLNTPSLPHPVHRYAVPCTLSAAAVVNRQHCGYASRAPPSLHS